MLYCKSEDLFEACKKSAVESWARDDSRDSDAVVQERINSAIARASDEMNLYLSKQYSLPLSYTPLSLKDICVKLSLYQLLSRKGLDTDSKDNTIKVNRDTALKQLEMISSGKLDLGIITNSDNEPLKNNSLGTIFRFPPSRMKR